jgi:hypothetical protein
MARLWSKPPFSEVSLCWPTVSIAQAIKPAAPPAKSPRKRQNRDDITSPRSRRQATCGCETRNVRGRRKFHRTTKASQTAGLWSRVGRLFGRSGSASIQQQQPKLSSVCEPCGRFLQREERNDQVDRCCWLCFGPHNIGTSNDARADSSAGRHDHASCLRLWPG